MKSLLTESLMASLVALQPSPVGDKDYIVPVHTAMACRPGCSYECEGSCKGSCTGSCQRNAR